MSGDATKGRVGRQSGRVELAQRIAVLLEEIEALGQRAADLPPPLLSEMHAILEKARRVLENGAPPPTRAESDGDPQPDIDQEILERMYRALGTGRSAKR